jgi:hypothetical protein
MDGRDKPGHDEKESHFQTVRRSSPLLSLSESQPRPYTSRSECDQIWRAMEVRMPGNRNIIYLIIGALIVAVGVLGYNLYQTKKEPEGLQINLGPNGLKIQNK